MKKILTFAAVAVLCTGITADDSIVAATLRADGSTNTWTQADLQAALGLLNRKYWRDMATDQGRRQWHGERIGQYILTNGTGLVRIDLYADGFAATNRAVKTGRTADPEAEAKAARARAEWERANLPPDLAALREAQRQAAATQAEVR